MTPAKGEMLSQYRLVEKIGEGGMGVVWKATDTTLDRIVAVKILPEAFSQDDERLARFEREAKLLASLNHPNIAVIHGLHHAAGMHFLAMELAPGEDLAQRIQRGAIPAEEAIAIAQQISEALEAAHESGVVHRDLKPANIQLAPDGKVKVLDFGLAKAFESDSPSGSPSMSPTMTSAGTRVGMILGTAAYMSPEQARGRPVDKRADIWAFGCVLYEMLAGRPVFGGETISDTLAGVLRAEPDWEALPAETPKTVDRLLRRCLIKDPKLRLRDIGEARIALRDASEARPKEGPAPMLAAASRRATLIPWVVAILMGLGLAATWALRRGEGPATTPGVVRLKAELSKGGALPGNVGLGAAAVISPDGRTLVFIAGEERNRKLHVRRLDRADSVALSGTEEARAPFFSPDGRWIGFFASQGLMKVGAEGGAPIRVADLKSDQGRGGCWDENDVIVFASGFDTGLSKAKATGGKAEPLTKLTAGSDERSHRWPSPLPGGKAVLFMTQRTGQDYDDADIEVADLATGRRKVVLHGGSYPRYAPGGTLLFVRENVLFGAPFDVQRLEVTGPARRVLEGIQASTADQEGSDGSAQYSLSATGTLVYRESEIQNRISETQFVWVDRSGKEIPAFTEPMRVTVFKISPDGAKVAMEARTDKGVGIWIRDLQRGATSPLGTDGDNSVGPVWSPDSRRLLRSWRPRDGKRSLRIGAVDGGGAEIDISTPVTAQGPSAWSPDGKTLLVNSFGDRTAEDFGMLPLQDGGKYQPLLETPGYDGGAQFSPDGKWIAYYSDGSGSPEIYVTPFPGPGPRLPVTTSGGGQVRWSPDGREIYFVESLSANPHLVVVPVQESGDSLRIGAPHTFYQGWLGSHPARPVYDPHPDGKRLLAIKRAPQDAGRDTSHVVLVFGWLEELNRKMQE
jgi:serine/threonine-protein kinase